MRKGERTRGLLGKEPKRPRRLKRWSLPTRREVEMIVYDEHSSRLRRALFPAAIIARAELALDEGWRSAFVPTHPWTTVALLAPEPPGPVVKPSAAQRMSPFSRGPVLTNGRKRANSWRRHPDARRRPKRR